MKISRAAILGAAFVTLAVVAAGCVGSNGDRRDPEARPLTGFPTLEATTAVVPEDSSSSSGPELEPTAIGETDTSAASPASEDIQESRPSSTAETSDEDASEAKLVDGQGSPILQSTKDVEVDLQNLVQLLSRDAIRPIYDPMFTSAIDAGLDPGELVIGVEINNDARAYPIGPLIRREMVNDVVGGVPILVTW